MSSAKAMLGISARTADAMTMLQPLPSFPAKHRRGPCKAEPVSAIPAESSATYFSPNCGFTNSVLTMPLTNDTARAKPTVRKDSNQILASSHKDTAPAPPPHRRGSAALLASVDPTAAGACTGSVPKAAAKVEASASARAAAKVAVMPTPASWRAKPPTLMRHSAPRDQKPNTAASPEDFADKGSPVAEAMRCADCAKNAPSAVQTKPAPRPQKTAPP
mmetsp:Transcript_76579/g.234461  ORF Transcript_76579/g.234461 Transcript_76579/m.234461 type:complete len:218 (+) Transcript_76579:794-1447(+)